MLIYPHFDRCADGLFNERLVLILANGSRKNLALFPQKPDLKVPKTTFQQQLKTFPIYFIFFPPWSHMY